MANGSNIIDRNAQIERQKWTIAHREILVGEPTWYRFSVSELHFLSWKSARPSSAPNAECPAMVVAEASTHLQNVYNDDQSAESKGTQK